MNSEINKIIQQTILEMIDESSSEEKIHSFTEIHNSKIHFIPLRYRIFGAILQSLNIKFGNFIETLISNIVEIDNGVTNLPESGEKVKLWFTHQTDALIDTYITERQLLTSPDDCTPQFDGLLREILMIERAAIRRDRQGLVKDVDALFQTSDGLRIFAEVKYNDDHDTGKFADINRKFIKTWAGLAVRFGISSPDELFPVLYYFNPTKRYGPIHTPSRNIMRGAQLFDAYLETKYEDVDSYLSIIGEDPEVLKIFDDIYDRVRNGSLSSRLL